MQPEIYTPPPKAPGKKHTLRALFVLALFFLLIAVVGTNVLQGNGALEQTTAEPPDALDEERRVFSSVSIEAESAIVWDMVRGKPLYEKNPEAQLPLASISKIMTILVAKRLINDDETVAIDGFHVQAEGDNGLTEGDVWRYADLSDFTLVVSSNDGARALASAASEKLLNKKVGFVDIMNETAKELGLRQTYFLNASGLDVEETSISGSYGSARDMARLLEYILRTYPTLLEATRYPSVVFNSRSAQHEAQNTNEILPYLSGVIASKTGYTDLAGGNLAVVVDVGLGHPVAIVVLGSSKDDRFGDVETLYEAVLDYFSGGLSQPKRM